MVQDARNAMERISTLISEVLACVESRSERDVEKLSKTLRNYLVSKSKNHGSVVSVSDAKRFGLPVIEADPADDQWRAIWRLWAKYILIETYRVYEGEQVSVIGGLSVSA